MNTRERWRGKSRREKIAFFRPERSGSATSDDRRVVGRTYKAGLPLRSLFTAVYAVLVPHPFSAPTKSPEPHVDAMMSLVCMLASVCGQENTVKTRFGPNRPAADMRESEDLLFW